jgi:hypothetical protein
MGSQPIYTAMVTNAAGVVLAVPNAVGFIGIAMLAS